jgi:CHASE3 domain sensor protein
MNDEPIVDDLKEKERLTITIEEFEIPEEGAKETPSDRFDVAAELSRLGRKVAETLRSALESDERQRIEQDLRQGMQSFVQEAEEVIREVRSGNVGQRVRGEAVQLKEQVESADLGRKMRSGMVQGLRWLSEEMGRLADQVAQPRQNPPADTADTAEESAEQSPEL